MFILHHIPCRDLRIHVEEDKRINIKCMLTRTLKGLWLVDRRYVPGIPQTQ